MIPSSTRVQRLLDNSCLLMLGMGPLIELSFIFGLRTAIVWALRVQFLALALNIAFILMNVRSLVAQQDIIRETITGNIKYGVIIFCCISIALIAQLQLYAVAHQH